MALLELDGVIMSVNAAWQAFAVRNGGDPARAGRALRNLLERDRMFTERLRAGAMSLGLRVIEVDVTMTEDDLARQVAQEFEL